jgi:hypothetical protein
VSNQPVPAKPAATGDAGVEHFPILLGSASQSAA